MKWIVAKELAKKGVTRRWEIRSKEGDHYLGIVKWHPGWRRMCFFPEERTCFEPDCLRDLAEFCETETAKRKEERRATMEELAREESWVE